MQVFIDMDGVISNFVKGVFRHHNMPEDTVFLPNKHYSVFKTFGLNELAFWENIDEGFWTRLERHEDANDLIAKISAIVGPKNVCFLSDPTNHFGAHGKLIWLQIHYPAMFRNKQYLIGPGKHFCASHDKILIDDSTENCLMFREAGGRVILYPRPWNENYELEPKRIDYTIMQLHLIVNQIIQRE